MAILRSQNKIKDFLMILAWVRRFNCLEAGVWSVVSYNNLLVEYEIAPY